MMTKSIIQYFFIVWLIISLDLIAQCQCSPSANIQQTSVNRSKNDVQAESRKLTDDVEVITQYSNVLDEDSPVMIGDNMMKDFQYFNDPNAIATPKYEPSKYEPPLSPEMPNNHRPLHEMITKEIHEMERNPGYYSQMDPVPYVPSESFMPPGGPPLSALEPIPFQEPQTTSDQSISTQLVKVIREPFWAPDLYKLEDKYMSTLRSLKSSMMNFYYRMHEMIIYFLNLFRMPGKL